MEREDEERRLRREMRRIKRKKEERIRQLILAGFFTAASVIILAAVIVLFKNVFQKNGWVHKKSAYRYAIKYRKMNVRYMRESSSYQLHYTDSVDKKLFKYVNDFIKNDMNIKKAINQK